jgi:NTE family protein
VTRRALVLGAGGVLGASWTIGALTALEEITGFDAREMDVLVGTSAGSVLVSLLGAGVSVDDLRRHQLDGLVPTGPLAGYRFDADRATGGALPLLPRPGIGSSQLLWYSLRRPKRVTPMAAFASILPVGRGSLAAVADLITATADGSGWSRHPALSVVGMDYDTGRRVAFGRPGSPAATLAQAVQASCAVPGWYAPLELDGRRYVDGGMCSVTSVDLVANQDIDEVYVLAPLVSFDYDEPRSTLGRLERSVRRSNTRRMLREAAKVKATNRTVSIVMLGPGREDLETIGVNLMDPARRKDVLETALRTTSRGLRRAVADDVSWTA